MTFRWKYLIFGVSRRNINSIAWKQYFMQQIIGNSCSASVIIVQIKFHFECLHYLGSIVLHLQCLK